MTDTDTKNKLQFTAGPWSLSIINVPLADTGEYESIIKIKSNHREVCEVFIGEDDEDMDNLLLITAAPDLYAALKECHEAMAYMSEYDIPIALPDQVKAVLDKAEGKP